MLKSIRLNRGITIKLPASIFRPSDRVAIVTEGNTVIVKKIAPSKLSEVISQKRGRPMPMREINKEIQRYRKEKRK